MVKITNIGKHGFTMINNQVVTDPGLSWKAKGILLYMRSRPDNWQFYSTEVAKHATDGRASLMAGLRELQERGYLKRRQGKIKNGKFGDLEWTIADTPVFLPQTDFPAAEKPAAEKPSTENQPLLSTDSTNTDSNKTDGKDNSPVGTGQSQKRIDYAGLIKYLNDKSGKHFKDTANNRKLIAARLHDGHFSEESVRKAIDHVVESWSGDPKMDQYVRPTTIFKQSKFEDYVAAPPYNSRRKQTQEDGESYGGIVF